MKYCFLRAYFPPVDRFGPAILLHELLAHAWAERSVIQRVETLCRL
jgi:hypothetical protein